MPIALPDSEGANQSQGGVYTSSPLLLMLKIRSQSHFDAVKAIFLSSGSIRGFVSKAHNVTSSMPLFTYPYLVKVSVVSSCLMYVTFFGCQCKSGG